MPKYKVLIVKIGALGDAVMASSMINAIRAGHQDAHITWLCGEEIAALVKTFKGVDEIITLNNKLLAGNVLNKIKFVLESWKKLLGRRYDLCLTGHSDSRYRLLSKTAVCKARRHFGGRFGPLPGRYHGTEYARLALGHDHSVDVSYALAETTVAPSEASKGMILLLPGGARNIMNSDGLRGWPVSHYKKLAEVLLSRSVPVGLIGGPDDVWLEDEFIGLPVRSFIGKTTVSELLEVIAGASALVSHDSGPMHMAYLLNTPLVALFGPVMPQSRLPYCIRESALFAGMPCSPCYDGRNYAGCSSNVCMQSVLFYETIKKLEEMKIIK